MSMMGASKESIIDLAIEVFGWGKTRVLFWYRTFNCFLNDYSPAQLVEQGEGQRVIDYLEKERQKKLAVLRRR